MAERFSKDERSRIMRLVRSDSNKSTELRLIEIFRKNGISGWRRNFRLFGKPDFEFPKIRLVVFVDGCFWHGHNCRKLKPKTNQKYWKSKIGRNKTRDREVS